MMYKAKALQLAVFAVADATSDGTPVAETTVVGIDEDGLYWVIDNGEQVNGLSRDEAIQIIIENLTAGEE